MASSASSNTYNKQLKLYSSNSTKKLINTSKQYCLNNDIIDTTKLKPVSEAKTGSKTYVYSFQGNGKYEDYNFIVKYTPYKLPKSPYFLIERLTNECSIYKLMKKFVENNVCPFVYYAFECEFFPKSKCSPTQIKNLNSIPIGKNTNIYMSVLKTNKINVTSVTLYSLLSDEKYILTELEIFVILFQIMYTLKCFEIIGLNHKDLHSQNIIIEIDETFKKNSYNKYIVGSKQYNIPNTKYTVKIFDFDLSQKNARDNLKKEYNVKLTNIYYQSSKYYNDSNYLNNDDNIMYDVLKILYHIATNKNIMWKSCVDLFFTDINMSKTINTKNDNLLSLLLPKAIKSLTKEEIIEKEIIEKIKEALPVNMQTLIKNRNNKKERQEPFDYNGYFSDPTYGKIKTLDEILGILSDNIKKENKSILDFHQVHQEYNSNKLYEYEPTRKTTGSICNIFNTTPLKGGSKINKNNNKKIKTIKTIKKHKRQKKDKTNINKYRTNKNK